MKHVLILFLTFSSIAAKCQSLPSEIFYVDSTNSWYAVTIYEDETDRNIYERKVFSVGDSVSAVEYLKNGIRHYSEQYKGSIKRVAESNPDSSIVTLSELLEKVSGKKYVDFANKEFFNADLIGIWRVIGRGEPITIEVTPDVKYKQVRKVGGKAWVDVPNGQKGTIEMLGDGIFRLFIFSDYFDLTRLTSNSNKLIFAGVGKLKLIKI